MSKTLHQIADEYGWHRVDDIIGRKIDGQMYKLKVQKDPKWGSCMMELKESGYVKFTPGPIETDEGGVFEYDHSSYEPTPKGSSAYLERQKPNK